MELWQRSLAFEFLHREHGEADRLLGELQAHAGDMERARRLLKRSLLQHMAVEEAVFYPALARMEMLAAFVERMRTQHDLIREALDALDAQPVADTRFDDAVRRLDELLDAHVQEEETRAFAYAAEHLTGELEGLAVEMEHRHECERGAYGVG